MFIKAQYDGNDVLLNTNCILDIWDYDKFGLKAKAFTINRDVYRIEKAELGKLIRGEQTEPQTYITEDRDTQILDAWQVHHRTSTTAVTDEPQTDGYISGEDFMKIFDEPQTDCAWK